MDDEPKPTPYPRSTPPGDEPRDEGEARRRRPVRATGKVLLALVSVAALVATGYAWATYHEVQGNVHTTDALDLPAGQPAPPADDGAEDILLVGADARTDMQGNALPLQVLKTLRTEQTSGVNTDTIIVVRIPKNGAKPYAVSIPRDTWIDVPRGGQGKINSVYGLAKQAKADELRRQGRRDSATVERDSDQAGRQALVQAVQDFTQVRIDHYAEVNLLGFYLITEALGGVEVCLNHATEDKDSGADFRAGVQTVSGGEALSFVRQRKNLPRGDLDRIVRQQAFLSSALHKVLSAGVLANPGTLGELTDALHRSLVLDPNFDLLQFADKAKGLATGDVTFTTIPVTTIDGRSPDGQQSIVQVDPLAVRQFFAGLAGRSPGSGGGASGGGAPAKAVPAGVSCVN
ncbi:LCP family protein [Amycolatopsis thermophila]|uniref:LCP family protein required for cell wall assembly n=1 Tax=Amycolatopsis thermophila TaxID=206084 RepID=A0ABU0EPU6_9PSEU|nr:LCP family protein [Amycolatopsis thermophila]MDQ0377307.1 LCP family protein required for cell wall assembly [Amycolatopsis thermophila]